MNKKWTEPSIGLKILEIRGQRSVFYIVSALSAKRMVTVFKMNGLMFARISKRFWGIFVKAFFKKSVC